MDLNLKSKMGFKFEIDFDFEKHFGIGKRKWDGVGGTNVMSV